MADECFSCEGNARLEELPPRERVVVAGGWRLVHAFDTSLPGWLVAVSLRHVTSVAALAPAEAAALGTLVRAASVALQAATGCAKTYAMLFAEKEGFAHLHVHVVPRMLDFDESVVGPRVFAFLGRPESEVVPAVERDRLALELRPLIERELERSS